MKGFTIIELIIYVTILAVILLISSNLLSLMLQSQSNAKARFEVNQNLRFALKKITEEVKKGSSISLASICNLNSLIIDGTKTFSISLNGILQFTENASIFDVTSNKVSIIDPGYCLFTTISNPGNTKTSLQIKMKMRYNNSGNANFNYSAEEQTTVSLR